MADYDINQLFKGDIPESFNLPNLGTNALDRIGADEIIISKKYGAGGIVSERPPTEFDNIHIEANKPTIFITSPSSGTTIDNNILNVQINATAPRGVNRVEYYIDGKLLTSTVIYPYELNYSLNSYLAKG